MAFAIALSSCNNDDSPFVGNQTAIDSADTQITLYISMSNTATTRAGTRADDDTSSSSGSTWGDDYNSADATTFETTISTLQVLFFNSDGSLAAVAEQTALWSYTSSSSSDVMYEYIGTVTPTDTGFTDANSNSSTTTNDDGTATTSFTGTVMVLANCPDATTTAYTTDDSGNITYTTSSSTSSDSDDTTSTDDATTNAPILIEDLLYDNGIARTATSGSKLTDVECMAYLTYDYADVTQDTGLPMWGMTTASSLTFTSGYNTSLGNIDLLRAMAKILVTFDDDTYVDGFTLTDIAVNRYLDAGYCLPSGYITTASTTSSSPATVSETTDLDQEECQNVYSDAGTVTCTLTETTATSTDYATGETVTYVKSITTAYAYEDGTTSTTAPEPFCLSADNGGLIIYLPEYDNANTSLSDDDHVTLTLSISRDVGDEDDDDNPYTGVETIYLRTYSTDSTNDDGTSKAEDDTDYGLVRNHQYAFTLNHLDNSEWYVTTTDDWETSTSSVGWDTESATVSFLAGMGTYDDCSEGDVDAVYCLLQYPRWADSSSSSSDHGGLKVDSNGAFSRSFASYGLNVSSDNGEITWAAFLDVNEDFFQFSTSQTTTDDLGRGHLNYRGSTNGVSRDSTYLIKLSPVYKWSQLRTMAKGTEVDGHTLTTSSPGTIWTSDYNDDDDSLDEETTTDNVNVFYTGSDGVTYKLVAIYTDLFILAKGTDGSNIKPLPINPTSSSSYFTPNWFPGGGENDISATVTWDGEEVDVTLSDNQWVRIYQARASLTSTADGKNSYSSISEWISEKSEEFLGGYNYWKE